MALTVTRPSAGRIELDIDGHPVSALRKFSGLDLEASIVSNDLGAGRYRKKHVADIDWTPAHVSVGLGMGQGMYDWIKASLDTGGGTRNGQLTLADINYKAQSLLTFTDATLTSFTVPALSGDSKDAGAFDLQFAVEQVRASAGDGHDIRGQLGTPVQPWLGANFRVEIGALPCARVASIDAFTWTCVPASSSGGIFREPQAGTNIPTVPDLRLSISYADHDAWAQAAKAWFIDGSHLESNEMAGRIVFLAPDMARELGSITLQNVGFRRFENVFSESGSDRIARFAVVLYVEKMTLRVNVYEP
ncbi:MAG: hypothetical protein ABJD97_21240 [Betaproteobacteria bacterium]